MMCFNPKFGPGGHNLSFFGLGPWAIIHGIAKLANTFILKYEVWWHHLKVSNFFQMMCFNQKFYWGPNLSFFDLGPWAIIHGIAKLANTLSLIYIIEVWWHHLKIFWKLRKIPFKWCVSIQNFVGAIICHFSALDHGLLFMVSPNWQILLSLKYELWWHHLKGIFLSFQKIQICIGSAIFSMSKILWFLKA